MKVWLLVLFLHTPDMPSIKYQAHLYKSEWDCSMAKEEYMAHYYSESESYREKMKTNNVKLLVGLFIIINSFVIWYYIIKVIRVVFK